MQVHPEQQVEEGRKQQILIVQKRIRRHYTGKPKRALTAYNYFSRDFFTKHHGNHQETIHEAAEEWKKLSDEQRRQFQRMSDNDKTRYTQDRLAIEEDFKKYQLSPMPSKRGEYDDCQ